MINCIHCNTLNLNAAQFCDLCGARLHSSQTSQEIIEPQMARRAAIALNDNNANSNLISALNAGESPAQKDLVINAVGNRVSPVKTQFENFEPITSAHSRLTIERGKNAGKDFVLSENETNIGRWDADNGVFPDVDLDADDSEAKVSRRHARIVRQNGKYTIEDLNSTNGTFVNRGRRLSPGESQILNDGDEIIVGKTFLRFQILG